MNKQIVEKTEEKVNSTKFSVKFFVIMEAILKANDALDRVFYFGKLSDAVWAFVHYVEGLERRNQELEAQVNNSQQI